MSPAGWTVQVIGGIFVAIWSLLPIYWAFVVAVSQPSDLTIKPVSIVPRSFSLDNFINLLVPSSSTGAAFLLGLHKLGDPGIWLDGRHAAHRVARKLRFRPDPFSRLDNRPGRHHGHLRDSALPRVDPAVSARRGDGTTQHPAVRYPRPRLGVRCRWRSGYFAATSHPCRRTSSPQPGSMARIRSCSFAASSVRSSRRGSSRRRSWSSSGPGERSSSHWSTRGRRARSR